MDANPNSEARVMTPRLALTIASLCELLGWSRQSFYNYQRLGRGPKTIRLGRKVLILESTFQEWLKAQEMESALAMKNAAIALTTSAEQPGEKVTSSPDSIADATSLRAAPTPQRVASRTLESIDGRHRRGPF